MKKLTAIIVLIAITISCSDAKKNKIASDTKIGQAQNDTYLKATIDGEAFYAVAPDNLSGGNLIAVFASNKDKTHKIKISIENNKGIGTYTIGKDTASMIYTNSKVHYIASKLRGEGIITLTEDGDYLVGKFSFIGTENDKTEKQITDGEFRVLKK